MPKLFRLKRTMPTIDLQSGLVSRWLAACHERWLGRRALEVLDDHALKDIGLTRLEALREAEKPFWRR